MSLTIGSLCSGAGGLDLAVADVLGDARTAWVADNDPDASRVLSFRFDAPNLGDITAVDWTRVEPVDVLCAGFPCQDISNAGQRAGIDGPKSGVWGHVATAIGVLRPRIALLENVAALLVRGGTRVVGDLAALGYVGSWRTLRASDVGAPHRRERVFIVAADPDREPLRLQHEPVGACFGAAVAGGDSARVLMPTPTASRADESRSQPSRELAARRFAQGRRMLDDAVALLPTPLAWEATRSGPHARYGNGQPKLSQIVTLLPTPRGSEGAKGGPNQRGSSGDLTLTSSVMLLPTPTASTGGAGDRDGGGMRLATLAAVDRWAQYGPAIRHWEAILGRPAPEPTVVGKRGGRRLSARFVEWLMGWPDGWVSSVVDNTSALRLCGNGVVPQQGAAAYRQLLEVVAHA